MAPLWVPLGWILPPPGPNTNLSRTEPRPRRQALCRGPRPRTRGDTRARARQAGPAPANYTSQQEWAAGRGLEGRSVATGRQRSARWGPHHRAGAPCYGGGGVSAPARAQPLHTQLRPAHLREPEPRPAPPRGWAAGEGDGVGLGAVAWEGRRGASLTSRCRLARTPFPGGRAAPTLKQD